MPHKQSEQKSILTSAPSSIAIAKTCQAHGEALKIGKVRVERSNLSLLYRNIDCLKEKKRGFPHSNLLTLDDNVGKIEAGWAAVYIVNNAETPKHIALKRG